MSVTREIQANVPTQVNTHTLGVEVYPGAASITVDYSYNSITSAATVDGKQLISTHDNNVYKYNGATVTAGGTTYYELDAYDGSTPAKLYNLYDEPLPSQTLFTIADETATPYTTLGAAFNVVGSGMQSDTDKVTITNEYTISGNYLISPDETAAFKVGLITATTPVVTEQTFSKAATSSWEGYVEYNNSDYEVWADSDNLSVGDELYFMPSHPAYNHQTVKSVTPGSANCTVSYSIEGDSWTAFATALTETNNVVCNIPKYVYLKFSQKVKITEE